MPRIYIVSSLGRGFSHANVRKIYMALAAEEIPELNQSLHKLQVSAYNLEMRPISHSSVTTLDLPDRIEFIVSREIGWIEVCCEVAFLIFFLWMAWSSKNYLLLIPLVVGVVVLANNLARGPVTRLSVTSENLIARGNLRSLRSGEVNKAVADLESLGYSTGGRGGTPGLYANRTLLLPGLDQGQVEEVISAICHKFPVFEYIPDSHSTTLFGSSTETLTLKLSNRPDTSNNRECDPPQIS